MKKIPKIIWLHIGLTVFVLIAYFTLDILNEQRLVEALSSSTAFSFSLGGAIKGRLMQSPYYILALLPMLIAFAWTRMKPRMKFALKFLVPLAGALIIPAAMYLAFWLLDDRWRGLLTVEIFVVCIFAYIANELALIITNRK